MRLGIEARSLFSRQKTGIPNYLLNLLNHLKEVVPDLELFLYAPYGLEKSDFPDIGKFTLREGPTPFGVNGYFWTKFIAPKLVVKDELDVFLAPRTLYPLGIVGKVPVVSILHDLCYLLHPRVVPFGTLLNYKIWLKRDIRRADMVVTVSSGTSDKMGRLLGRVADAVIPPAVESRFAILDKPAVTNLLRRYGLTIPYLLFIGTLEPRKNLEALLDALGIVNSRRDVPLTLVLAGKRGWRNRRLIGRLDRGEPNVRELGYVPDDDLPALYNGAECFVIPSIYEGFGMPAAEARACGTRIVASDISELREAAGPTATYVEPRPEDIAKGIEGALTTRKPPAECVWTWNDSARKLADVLSAASRIKPSSA